MNYEQKYKEAIERARYYYSKDYMLINSAIENIFPELKDKESKDEQIRKAIHMYLDWLDGRKGCQPVGIYSIRDMIAWLEKQGEKLNTELDDRITISKAEYERLKELEKRMEISNISHEIQRNTLLYQLELMNRRNELRKEIQGRS